MIENGPDYYPSPPLQCTTFWYFSHGSIYNLHSNCRSLLSQNNNNNLQQETFLLSSATFPKICCVEINDGCTQGALFEIICTFSQLLSVAY